MPEAFHSIGAKTVYAYAHSDGTSSPVTDDFARAMQDSVLTNLILEEDTTGIAHLEADQYLQRDLIGKRRPVYEHTFFKLYDPWENANGLTPEEIMMAYDFTFDIPKVNKDLWFHQFFDEGYKYGCGTFTDPRDGKIYQTVCIGDQVWMAENLSYEGAGSCYDGNPNSCETFGRLYTWNEITNGQSSEANPSGVQGICPEGWHAPSMEEWQELISFAGGSHEAGRKLKANSPLWVDSDPNTDDFGFAALPAGRCDGSDCYNEDDEAIFWTSSTYGSGAPRYVLMQGIDPVTDLNGNLDLKISCRCVKDE